MYDVTPIHIDGPGPVQSHARTASGRARAGMSVGVRALDGTHHALRDGRGELESRAPARQRAEVRLRRQVNV
jgi:hypothetical protein